MLQDFTELQELAERGDRGSIDLFVKDTAGSGYSFAPPDAMVSSFGRVAKLHAHDPGEKECHVFSDVSNVF